MREAARRARRIVVKIGSAVLSTNGNLHRSIFGQIAQDRQGVSPIGILGGKLGQGAGRFAAQDHVKEVEHAATVCETQHRAHLHSCGFTCAMANRLIKQ